MRAFRRDQLPARESLRAGGVEFHRHYAGSTACLPSRTTLFTGQYPSLHGASQTDGLAEKNTDPAMSFLDPNSVPTLGDWFRAGGYHTHYRGKWHVSHADLLSPEQVVELFRELAAAQRDGPWLAVASFVNPHDISFGPTGWRELLGFGPPDDAVPEIPEAPSQADSFTDRPPCQEQFKAVWPKMLFDIPPDLAYRRLYYFLHKVVDQAIARILEALHDGLADDTIVVFTSDHGDLVGAHGGLIQKWYNAYDEAVRVPRVVTGPVVARPPGGITLPTSHVDLLPTLLGLAGIDVERAAAGVAEHHDEAHPLPGRDLSAKITGSSSAADSVAAPLYFMTDDDVSRGSTTANLFTGEPFEPVAFPSRVESVIATLPTGSGGADELWKLNHYYERLDDWDAAHGIPKNPFAGPAADPQFELDNLTADPDERHNRIDDASEALSRLQSILDSQREAKRLVPSLRNH